MCFSKEGREEEPEEVDGQRGTDASNERVLGYSGSTGRNKVHVLPA